MSWLGLLGPEKYQRWLRGEPLEDEPSYYDSALIPPNCPHLTFRRSKCAACNLQSQCNFLKGERGVPDECRHLNGVLNDCFGCQNLFNKTCRYPCAD